MFRIGTFTFALTARTSAQVTTRADGVLTYRLSRGGVQRQGSFLDLPDLARISGPVTWWVEAVDDFTRPRSAVGRSPESRFTVVK